MQIAICDDEKIVQDMLAERILKLYPDTDILLFSSGKELLSADAEPDILFMDIQMPDIDGMDTAREFRTKNKHTILIFVTAMEEYVFQAFDVGAFHYIVKPFTDEKFDAVLENAVDQYQALSDNVTYMSEYMHRVKNEGKSLMVKTGGTATKISLADIVYAEVFNRKVTIHMMKEDIEYYGKLSDLEKRAGDGFFRTHRAYLVNLKYVVKYNAATVWLERGSALMAKQNYHGFVKKYLRYNLKN